MRLALVCGELSGDELGAGLAEALLAQWPEVDLVGVTGPRMRALGVRSWLDCETFAVMGYWAALRRLPSLLAGRRLLTTRLNEEAPAVFVGIDAPDLNMALGRAAKDRGGRYVQYGCPTFWAWRAARADQLAKYCDEVLCLLPFEVDLCMAKGIAATFVGHRVADRLTPVADRSAAKRSLGLASDRPLLALLPGSREQEIDSHARLFSAAAGLLVRRQPDLQVVWAPPDSERARAAIARAGIVVSGTSSIQPGRAREVLAAADTAIVKSGTASLEAAMLDCPVVVAYVVPPLAKWLIKLRMPAGPPRYVAWPNLVLGRQIVPELLFSEATAERLATAAERFLAGLELARLRSDYAALRSLLRRDADSLAARQVLALAA